jgi:hypothetical protein
VRYLRNWPRDLEVTRRCELCTPHIVEDIPKPPRQFEAASVRSGISPSKLGIECEESVSRHAIAPRPSFVCTNHLRESLQLRTDVDGRGALDVCNT